MPTKEQMDAVLEQLERREIQYEGLNLAGLANANSDIDWTGFTESQRRGVELRIYDGDSPDLWMDGVVADGLADPEKEQFKQILAEQRTDYEAARLRDAGEDYEKFLANSTERALSRMQGKDTGHER